MQSNMTPNKSDGENIAVPDIPTPLTSTFTTHFDMRKACSSHTSTAMGMGRERRASMESLGEAHRPHLDPSSLGDEKLTFSYPDTAEGNQSGNTFHDKLWASSWLAGVFTLAGIFIIYRWAIELR
ncbi:hypothetical protein BDV97DRAFT_418316 [Delphinella strobiligena]|nr:hypothetical protein BDV97DRAFT_418316 [Delphinella strobiligena]